MAASQYHLKKRLEIGHLPAHRASGWNHLRSARPGCGRMPVPICACLSEPL